MFEAFLREGAARYARPTLRRYGDVLDTFLRWAVGRDPTLNPGLLTRRALLEHHEWLQGTRTAATAALHITILQVAWRWAANDDELDRVVPRPKVLRLQAPATTRAVAPTWSQMDAAIHHCRGKSRRLAILLRFTGLRVRQALGLEWADVDLEAGLMTIRGELGKTRQERAGRVFPMSPHLVAELRSWGAESGRIVGRQHRGRELGDAWAATDAPDAVWKGRIHHAFRKGFTSELKRAGADSEAVEFLVGHSAGIRHHYVDPRALPLLEAVRLIPPVSTKGE